MLEIDLYISQILFNLGQALPTNLVIFFASYLIWVMLVILMFVANKKEFRIKLLVKVFIALSIAYIISTIIGLLFFRDRPFISSGIHSVVNVTYPLKSFPSDHASIAWALGVSIALYYKKIALIILAIALLVSLGRVLAGVHFVGDVLAGAVIGSLSAITVYYINKKI